MRLDHLLSKENRVFLFCRLVGCWLVPGGGKFFQVGNASHVVLCACVVWELMRQEFFAVFRPCWLEGLSKVCLCFGLFCFVACCWVSGATQGCCSIKSPLLVSKTFLLVVAHEFCFGSHVVGCCLLGWCVV